MEKQAGKDMELLCDSQAVENLSKEEKKKYSEMLLSCASKRTSNHFRVIRSSEFSEDTKTLKERFANIFANEKRRKGILLAAMGVCAIVAVSVFVTFGNEENCDSSGLDETVNLEATTSQEVSLVNILIVGNDSFVTDNEFFGNEEGHADTIMVVTLNKEMNRIVLTSFLKDMYVIIPGYNEGKLADSYMLGGKELLVETLKVNFSVIIHGVVECDYEDFENVIDNLGGAELKLTAGEAEALNTTNYISDPENRTLEKGLQKLNGNQALGYVRIRQAQDFEGNSGDFARTGRQRRLMESL